MNRDGHDNPSQSPRCRTSVCFGGVLRFCVPLLVSSASFLFLCFRRQFFFDFNSTNFNLNVEGKGGWSFGSQRLFSHSRLSHTTTLGAQPATLFPPGGGRTQTRRRKKKRTFFPPKNPKNQRALYAECRCPCVVVDFDFAAGKKIFSKRHGLCLDVGV